MIIALTSARENSIRLYRKELNKIGDKFVIEYTLEQMEACNLFDIRIMSTDWIELIELMKDKYPSIMFLERPKRLAQADTPAQEYIIHALELYKNGNHTFCLLQSTSPLRSLDLIYDTFSKFTKDYNSCFTINKYTLQPDGQIYWFKDIYNIWKEPCLPIFCEPSVDLDYPSDLGIANYLVRGLDKN